MHVKVHAAIYLADDSMTPGVHVYLMRYPILIEEGTDTAAFGVVVADLRPAFPPATRNMAVPVASLAGPERSWS